MNLASRVAARFCLSNLEVGRGIFTQENLKIHRFRDHIRITDMTFAGKRGKVVKSLAIVQENLREDNTERVLQQAISSIQGMDYSQAKTKLETISEKYPGLFRLSESSQRGVDVEPMGTPVELERKFPNGTILRIKSTPHEFHVTNSVPLGGSSGKPGFRQDTSYWGRSKKDGVVFFAWAKDNLSKLSKMTILELMELWHSLGVSFDQH